MHLFAFDGGEQLAAEPDARLIADRAKGDLNQLPRPLRRKLEGALVPGDDLVFPRRYKTCAQMAFDRARPMRRARVVVAPFPVLFEAAVGDVEIKFPDTVEQERIAG